MKKGYTISELEKLTGISRRTIYFYTQENLLPPPEGAGPGARYSEEHYLRLKLIVQMRKSHLKLAGIKEALDKLNTEEMKTQVNETDKTNTGKAWNLVEQMRSDYTSDLKIEEQEMPMMAENRSFVKEKTFIKKKEAKKETEDTNNWRRHNIMEGLEVNIRTDVEAKYGKILIKLLNEFYKLIKTAE